MKKTILSLILILGLAGMVQAGTTVVDGSYTCTTTASGICTGQDSLTLPAGTTAKAPLTIPHGDVPTSPVNGNVWSTTAGIYGRINGTTVGPFLATSTLPAASTTVAGVTEYATDAETTAASAADKALTPANLDSVTVLGTVTSGTISGLPVINKLVDGHTALSLSAAQISGTQINNVGQGPNDINHTIAALVAGQSFLVHIGETQAANYFRITPPTGTACLDGTCEKNFVQFATPVRGNEFVCKMDVNATTGLNASAAVGIGSTVTNVATGAFTFDIAGAGYTKAAVAAGTAPGNDVIPSGKYGAVALDVGVNGTIDAIEAADNASGYDSAALAIAGLPAVEAAHTRLGTVTVVKSDGDFTFGTTALSDANTTVAYTSTAAYTRPVWLHCTTLSGTATTN